jgi:hypothetical protein
MPKSKKQETIYFDPILQTALKSEPNLPFESDSFLDAVTKGLTEISEGKLTSLEDTKKKLEIDE